MKNFIFRIFSIFIFSKINRRKFRDKYLSDKKYKAKFGASYSLFDGEELLEASLRSIRESLDYINVIYQKVSYYGQPANPDIEKLLENLKQQGLIDEYLLYIPDLNKKGGVNELKKRNIGYKMVCKAGCDYFMSMDTDEFYIKDELETAKKYVLHHDVDVSAVTFINYVKKPTYQIVNNNVGFVPLFIKIKPWRRIGKNMGKMPVVIDPTRGVSRYKNFYLFPGGDIVMHHMSWVRKDLKCKFYNSSLNDCAKYRETIEEQLKDIDTLKITDEMSPWKDGFIRKVENQFGINT